MKKHHTLLLASTAVLKAFENKAGWKVDEDGKILTDDSGDPIYVDGDGREMTLGASTISRLNGEARSHRQAKEAAEAKLAEYEGIDAEAAREALEKVSKLNGHELIEAGKVDELKAQITSQFQSQIDTLTTDLTKRESQIENMTRTNAFNGSTFVRERLNLSPDLAEAAFSRNFKFEDGKIVPYDGNGGVIYSRKNMGGVVADFDEALEILIEGRSDKDRLLRAPEKSGTGGGGGGGSREGSRNISRAEFNEMTPIKKAEAAALAGQGELTIAD